MANLMIVDIQPAYNKHCLYILGRMKRILKEYKKIVVFYNDEEIGGDSEENLKLYYYDSGIPERTIDRMQFVPKQYGFFRGWMDTGVSDSDIIEVAKKMIKLGKYDSRDIKHNIYNHDCIYIPDIEMNQFKRRNWDLIGGSITECLYEIELLMDSYKIRHERVSGLIY